MNDGEGVYADAGGGEGGVPAQGANGSGGASAADAGKSAGAGASDNDDSSSLLTRQEPDARQEAEDTADPSAFVPAKPEDYTLDFGDDVQVDEGLLNNFKATAHELGIPQGQARKLADFYAKHTAESAKAAQDAQAAALVQARQGWEKEITSRPDFKQEVNDARRTLKEFGSPELNEIMDTSLLGSHPVFFDFVVKVGKALAEPEARGTGIGGGKDKPLMDRLWPDMK